MTNEDLKLKITELHSSAAFDEGGEWLNVFVEPENIKALMQQLRSTKGLDFDYLFCLTCVDFKTHFTIVYHLTSTIHRHAVVIKAKLNHDHPEIETVCDIWRTAELLARDAYDLVGVIFLHHPVSRRLLLTDDWVGYPLRKDYEDPINMIKL